MENEDKPVKTGNMEEEAPVQQNNHGFAIHSSGTWEDEEQKDEVSLTAENNDTSVRADLPPKINDTEGEG
jgi:hypothetical protein